jgi:hypothetical protein
MKVYELPTAVKANGTITQYNGSSYVTVATSNNIVIYDKKTLLTNGEFGTTKKIQVSTDIVSELVHNMRITIGADEYNILDPKLCTNPAFTSFYQAEIKKIT